ncbi:MAG: signal peptide peptidase SppA [Kiritimatiellae bacterium]|nr:signal peptide peptidase SppA [Kiritimatiellia bacterium]
MDTVIVKPSPEAPAGEGAAGAPPPPPPKATIVVPPPEPPPEDPPREEPAEESRPFPAGGGTPPREPFSVRRAAVLVWRACAVFSVLFTVLAILAAFSLVAGIRGCVERLPEALGRASASSADDPFRKEELKALDPAAKTPHRDAPRVVYVPLRGEISPRAAAWSGDGDTAAEALRQIRLATADPDVSGILLDVDSPGGDVTASDTLHDALLRFRKGGEGRRVVARLGSVAASGAYYVAVAADWIVAADTTLTGSIGVKMESLNVKQLAESNGVRAVSIVSGKDKNVMSPFEDLTDDQRRSLQKMVDAMHARFVSVVAAGRHLEEDRVKQIADGRVLLGADALKEGLVDQTGQIEEATEKIRSWFGGKSPRYVRYSRRESVVDLFSDPAFWGSAVREAVPSARPGGVSAPSAKLGE